MFLPEIDVRNLLLVGSDNLTTSPIIEHYNATRNEWIALTSINLKTTNYAVTLYNDHLLTIGGVQHPEKKITNMVYDIDLLNGHVTKFGGMLVRRNNPGVAVVGEGKSSVLYVMGGTDADGEPIKTVERFENSTKKWVYVSPMNFGRGGSAVAVHDGDIYVFGGVSSGENFSNEVEVYIVKEDRWESRLPMIHRRGYCNAVSNGRHIYVLGGYFKYLKPINALHSVSRYDPEKNDWKSLSGMSSCSGSIGVLLMNGLIYAVGGFNSTTTEVYSQEIDEWQKITNVNHKRNFCTLLKVPMDLKCFDFDWTAKFRPTKNLLTVGTNNFDTTNKMEMFDTLSNKWKILDHRYTGTKNYAATMLDDRLIIAGGIIELENTVTDLAFEIMLLSGKILPLCSMNEPRNHTQLVTIGKKESARVYAIGGMSTDDRATVRTVERWDPTTDRWTFVSPMILARQGHAATSHRGDIYVIGGFNEETMNQIEVYIVQEDRWELKAPMNYTRSQCRAVSDGNYIYVVGGYNGHVELNIAERYNSSTDTWEILKNLPSSGLVCATLMGNTVVVIGGTDSKSMNAYDHKKNEWRSLPSMKIKGEVTNALQLPWKWRSYDFEWATNK